VFGRRQREDQAEAREAERRALFEELAKRPDTVCPFLGLAGSRAEYHQGVTREHRCYAFGEPADLSAEQQEKVCLQRGYGNCPRYLRGVLVIPTEELEALRRPMAAGPLPPLKPATPPKPAKPVPPSPALAPVGSGGRRRGFVAAGMAFLLVAGGAAAALILLNRGPVVVVPTPSASPSQGSQPASPSVTPVPTPIIVSAGPLPTVGPGDRFEGYAIFVAAGTHQVVRIDEEGNLGERTVTGFNHVSPAPVDRVVIGTTDYWRTLIGGYTGLAYTRDLSGEYTIYEVYRAADNAAHFRELANA
jgi:hypothetical protein